MEVPKHALKPRERGDTETQAKDTALGHSNIQRAAQEAEKERPGRQKHAGRKSRKRKATEGGQLLLLEG